MAVSRGSQTGWRAAGGQASGGGEAGLASMPTSGLAGPSHAPSSGPSWVGGGGGGCSATLLRGEETGSGHCRAPAAPTRGVGTGAKTGWLVSL